VNTQAQPLKGRASVVSIFPQPLWRFRTKFVVFLRVLFYPKFGRAAGERAGPSLHNIVTFEFLVFKMIDRILCQPS